MFPNLSNHQFLSEDNPLFPEVCTQRRRKKKTVTVKGRLMEKRTETTNGKGSTRLTEKAKRMETRKEKLIWTDSKTQKAKSTEIWMESWKTKGIERRKEKLREN